MAAKIRRLTGKGIPLWVEPHDREIERAIDASKALDTLAVFAVPDPAVFAGRMLYVPDESGGPALAFSDGVNWRRLTLGPPIS